MYIVDVIPFSKGAQKDELSYFCSDNIPTGSLVEIPLRKKKLFGVVARIRAVSATKAEIKSLPYEMKKLVPLSAKGYFRSEFLRAVERTAAYYVAPLGPVIRTLLPTIADSDAVSLADKNSDHAARSRHDIYVTQGPTDDRYTHYKSLIREEFAKRNSVFFCLPTVQDIHKASKILEKGIEEYTFVLHGGASAKGASIVYKKALTTHHPVLIIATGAFLHMPRKDIGAIVVDRENSRSYKTIGRPVVDVRFVAEQYAKEIGAKLILGDSLLRVETSNRHMNGEALELAPLKQRSLTRAFTEVTDMRTYKSTPKRFAVFSEEAIKLVEENRVSNENFFILAARKGLSPTTVCGDCGNIVVCKTCGRSVVLHSGVRENFFLCLSCGEKRSADELCSHCGSWKLIALGIGVDRVKEEIKKLFPHVTLFVMDKDKAPSHARALALAESFYTTPGSILIGTEMALLYLDRPISNILVATIDSLFSIPDFRMNEKILRTIIDLRTLAEKRFIVQTRRPDEPVFAYATSGNLAEFVRSEIEIRKLVGFPPFRVIIKIVFTGAKDRIAEDMAHLKKMLPEEELDVFPSYIRAPKGSFSMNAVLRLDAKRWPRDEIAKILRSLPPHANIEVDPDSLL